MTSNSGQWKPGQSGNPLGGPKDKIVTDAIRVAVLDVIKTGKHKGTTKLRRIAEVVADAASEGQPWAVQMIADRLDGRPLQQSEAKVEMGASELFLEILRQMNDEAAELRERSGAGKSKTIEHSANGQDQPAAEPALIESIRA